jgi:molybdopterin-guanine dinucleotide biosynthesis protein A
MDRGSWRTEAVTASVAVLAGGRATRMGVAKAGVLLGGVALISYPLAAAAAAGLDAVVVAKQDMELPRLQVPVIREQRSSYHPLSGVLAALDHLSGQAVVVVGCDMPFVGPRLLRHLACRHEPAVVGSHEGRLQPLPARYGASLRPVLEAVLVREGSLRDALGEVEAVVIGHELLGLLGDPQRMFVSINEPGDLLEAEALLGEQPALQPAP